MRVIKHKTYCSGTYHEVWRDTEGRLHRTCNGEGCTQSFERARALLAGQPDRPPGRAHTRDRYWAGEWGGDWQNAKRRGWWVRAARRRARGEPVVQTRIDPFPMATLELPDWPDGMYDSVPTLQRIANDVRCAVEFDLQRTTYRLPRSTWLPQTHMLHIDVVSSQMLPEIMMRTENVRKRTKSGKALHAKRCHLVLTAPMEATLRLRIALGGSNLFTAGDAVYAAAAILEKRPEGTIVLAGQPGRGYTVRSMPALIARSALDATLVKWVPWQELADETVAAYALGLTEPHRQVISTDMCMIATRARPEYATIREAHASLVLNNAVRAARDLHACKSALNRLPMRAELESIALEAIHAARAYGDQWGELVGCPKTCQLFVTTAENVLMNQQFCCKLSESYSISTPTRQEYGYRCPVATAANSAHVRIEASRTLARVVNINKTELREATELLTEYGFRVNKQEELEEIPLC